jgi:hypothetical protein
MGYYIQLPNNQNKAKQLVDLHNAELVLSPESFDFSKDKALICVVENQLFEAAGIAFNPDERDAFLPTATDRRPRTWVMLPKTKVTELCPDVSDMLV